MFFPIVQLFSFRRAFKTLADGRPTYWDQATGVQSIVRKVSPLRVIAGYGIGAVFFIAMVGYVVVDRELTKREIIQSDAALPGTIRRMPNTLAKPATQTTPAFSEFMEPIEPPPDFSEFMEPAPPASWGEIGSAALKSVGLKADAKPETPRSVANTLAKPAPLDISDRFAPASAPFDSSAWGDPVAASWVEVGKRARKAAGLTPAPAKNFFAQFDEPAPAKNLREVNPYDQFDEPAPIERSATPQRNEPGLTRFSTVDGDSITFDANLSAADGRYRDVLEHWRYSKQQKGGATRSDLLREYDCKRLALALVSYTDYNASGTVLERGGARFREQIDFDPVTPDSIAESILTEVCKSKGIAKTRAAAKLQSANKLANAPNEKRWHFVGAIVGGDLVFLDPASVVADGNIRDAWKRWIYQTPENDGTVQKDVLYEYDCANQSAAIIGWGSWDKSGAPREPITLTREAIRFDPVRRGSIGADLLQRVCKSKATAGQRITATLQSGARGQSIEQPESAGASNLDTAAFPTSRSLSESAESYTSPPPAPYGSNSANGYAPRTRNTYMPGAVPQPQSPRIQQTPNTYMPRAVLQSQSRRIQPLAPSTSYNQIGQTIFSSDGRTYQQIGSSLLGSDGSSYQRIGSQILTNTGTSYSQIGKSSFGSDGSSATTIGNTIFITDPKGKSSTCSRIGGSTFCN
jgi:hypothetical protein